MVILVLLDFFNKVIACESNEIVSATLDEIMILKCGRIVV